MSKIEIGSRVKYATRWLKSIACHTGDLPFARGTVVEIVPLGAKRLCRIDWGNPNIPERVIADNLSACR